MPGPGEYRPDPTLGITRPEDLPKPNVSVRSRNYRRRPCPHCGHRTPAIGSSAVPSTTWATPSPSGPATSSSSARSTTADPVASTSTPTPPTWPSPAAITPAGSSTPPSGWSSRTASPTALPNGPYSAAIACSSPSPRSRTGSRPGKKAARRIDGEHLDWALSDFSGYLAVNELYDGPFCVLSIVNNVTFKRLTYRVLDHDPTHVNITAFFRRFHAALTARGLTVKGITTDGSACIRADRRGLRRDPASALHLPCHPRGDQGGPLGLRRSGSGWPPRRRSCRGPPRHQGGRRAARRKEAIKRKVGELFDHRYLFVRRR